MQICKKCGVKNDEGLQFCSYCGHDQSAGAVAANNETPKSLFKKYKTLILVVLGVFGSCVLISIGLIIYDQVRQAVDPEFAARRKAEMEEFNKRPEAKKLPMREKPSPTPDPSVLNIAALANKSLADVKKVLGEPLEAAPCSGKKGELVCAQFTPAKYGFDTPKKREIWVYFSKDKAIEFAIAPSSEMWRPTPSEFGRQFGFEVSNSPLSNEDNTPKWRGSFQGAFFSTIWMKSSDKGYSYLHAELDLDPDLREAGESPKIGSYSFKAIDEYLESNLFDYSNSLYGSFGKPESIRKDGKLFWAVTMSNFKAKDKDGNLQERKVTFYIQHDKVIKAEGLEGLIFV